MTALRVARLGFSVAILGGFAVACTASTSDDVGSTKQAQISDIATMTQRSDGQFDVVCKNGSREVVSAAQVAANQVCVGGSSSGGPGPVGGPGRVVIFGTSDSCDPSDVVASVNSATDCNTLSDSQAAWSVSVSGQCINISDTTVRKACMLNQPGRVLIFGTSDSCDASDVVASVGENTDCAALSDSSAAWSVSVDGHCQNISDTTVRKACMLNQPNHVLLFGTSDSCDPSDVAASVGATTDCSSLSDSAASWSVSINGQCNNISDTTLRKACILYQPG